MPAPATFPLPVRLILIAGIAFLVMSRLSASGPASPLAFLEWPLVAAMVWLAIRGGLGWRPARAGAAFVALSWAFGMIYEATLTVDGSGIGGVHPQTAASFVLAQGDYIALALVAWWMIRRWGLGFAGALWLALGKSLTEGLIFTGVLTANLMSPAAPLMLAYFTMAYGYFIALPMLILAPPAGARPRPPAVILIVAGFAAALAVRLFWGLVWAPAVTWALDLPANPL